MVTRVFCVEYYLLVFCIWGGYSSSCILTDWPSGDRRVLLSAFDLFQILCVCCLLISLCFFVCCLYVVSPWVSSCISVFCLFGPLVAWGRRVDGFYPPFLLPGLYLKSWLDNPDKKTAGTSRGGRARGSVILSDAGEFGSEGKPQWNIILKSCVHKVKYP